SASDSTIPSLITSLLRVRHHSDHHSFPTRRSSDLSCDGLRPGVAGECRDLCEESRDRHAGTARDGAHALSRPGRGLLHLCRCERSEEHTSELQSRFDLVCRLLLEKKKLVANYLSRQ